MYTLKSLIVLNGNSEAYFKQNVPDNSGPKET